jgi:phosphonate transport system substrate-binding protein
MGRGITQLYFLNSMTYVMANRQYGVEALVKAIVEGKTSYRSVIVAGSDSKMNSVKDIRGNKFAFGDPHSVSGYLAPRIMLLDAGIDLKDLVFYEYLGHHEEVVKAVTSGSFDAGGVTESIAYRYKDKGIKHLAYSDDLPVYSICVSKNMPQQVRSVLESALTALIDKTPEGSSVLHAIYNRYSGFERASDADYSNIRTMMSRLGMV